MSRTNYPDTDLTLQQALDVPISHLLLAQFEAWQVGVAALPWWAWRRRAVHRGACHVLGQMYVRVCMLEGHTHV